MKLRRVERPRGWTSIPNETLEDESLSWRARGILAYLLSRPSGWETDSERLARLAKEGRDAVRTALTELEDARYLFRVKVQGAGGRWSTEYVLYDRPLDPTITPGWAPPLDVEAGETEPEKPVHNPVDNGVETCAQPTPENPSPAPEKPTTGNPALITTKEEQQDQIPSATTEALAPLAKSDDGSAVADPDREAERDALSDAAELTLDGPSAAALADMQRRAPGIDMFALRAHLVVALGDASLIDARRYALAVARSVGINPSLLTTGLVLQAAERHVRSTTADGSAVGTALTGRQAGDDAIAQPGGHVKSQNGSDRDA